jgi:hypothetical protein
MTREIYANSSRARCAIYSRETTICIYSVSQLYSKNPFVKISSWAEVMGIAEYFCRPDHFCILSKYGHIPRAEAKPHVAAPPGAGLAGKPRGAQP